MSKKIIAVIPARYGSTRLPGKPLVEIAGRPMLYWVHKYVSEVPQVSQVVVATDDERIVSACVKFNITAMLTSTSHATHIHRVHEISTKLDADLYLCINGDEPLLNSSIVASVIPNVTNIDGPYVGGCMREFTDPAEVIDFSKIKIAANTAGVAVYMSRSPIPYPRGSLQFRYKKYVGVECFNREALDFFVNTQPGALEVIEDIDHLRFLENGVAINFVMVESDSISVDTPKDLERVKTLMKKVVPEE